jgi:hypothetical protein
MISPFTAEYQFTSKDVRFFLASVAQKNVSSSTVHAHTRVLRAFMNFCYEEEYIAKPVKVPMPKVRRKRMEVLSQEVLKRILKVCSLRDKPLFRLFANIESKTDVLLTDCPVRVTQAGDSGEVKTPVTQLAQRQRRSLASSGT